MPRFIFRFNVPLRQAVSEEQQAQRALAERLRTRLILQTQLRQMQQTISQAKHQLGNRLTGKVDLAAVGEVARYAGDSTLRGREIVQRLGQLEQQITNSRQELLHTTQRRRSFELLRDRDLAAWRKDQNRRETRVLDDVAARAYTRKLVEGAA